MPKKEPRRSPLDELRHRNAMKREARKQTRALEGAQKAAEDQARTLRMQANLEQIDRMNESYRRRASAPAPAPAPAATPAKLKRQKNRTEAERREMARSFHAGDKTVLQLASDYAISVGTVRRYIKDFPPESDS